MCLTKASFPQAITESDLVLHSQRWRSNIFIAFVRKIQYCTAAPADTLRGRQISKIQFFIYHFLWIVSLDLDQNVNKIHMCINKIKVIHIQFGKVCDCIHIYITQDLV